MEINWFTVAAQVINFLILMWLLKKFLYKPILNAVNEREKNITDKLKDADAHKAIAQKEQDDFKKRNENFDNDKKALLNKAIRDADAEKSRLIAAAKADAKALGFTLKKELKQQQERDKKEFTKNAQTHVFAITRKALADIASVNLEAQTANTFIKRLKTAKEEEKQQLISAFQANSDAIVVKSAFTLSAKQQQEITDAVNELLNTNIELQFKKSPELISGIELSTNGYKMAWSFSEYLSALDLFVNNEYVYEI